MEGLPDASLLAGLLLTMLGGSGDSTQQQGLQYVCQDCLTFAQEKMVISLAVISRPQLKLSGVNCACLIWAATRELARHAHGQQLRLGGILFLVWSKMASYLLAGQDNTANWGPSGNPRLAWK